MNPWLVVLAASLATLAWTYAGYPLLMLARARFAPCPTRRCAWQPRVTVCMAVHDGAAFVEAKLRGLLEHDYPVDRLDVVVVSDGSTDGTNALLRRFAGPRVRVIEGAARRGKTACLAEAIAAASGEVLVFTDVRQRLAPGSVQALCDALATGELAAVGGVLQLEDAAGYALSVDAYWRYETALRGAEAATGSVVGVSGALYAVRRADMPVPPPGIVLDDLWVPMRIAARGGRIGLEPSAVAFDRASPNAATEAARKRRTLAGNWQLIVDCPALLLPGAHPLAWRFLSHKALRLLGPALLAAALVANLALIGTARWAHLLLALQLSAYGLALAGLGWPSLRALLPVKLASAFLEMNAYAALGFLDFLRGQDAHLWRSAPTPPANDAPRSP